MVVPGGCGGEEEAGRRRAIVAGKFGAAHPVGRAFR
jgi:hypothetical protein